MSKKKKKKKKDFHDRKGHHLCNQIVADELEESPSSLDNWWQ